MSNTTNTATVTKINGSFRASMVLGSEDVHALGSNKNAALYELGMVLVSRGEFPMAIRLACALSDKYAMRLLNTVNVHRAATGTSW